MKGFLGPKANMVMRLKSGLKLLFAELEGVRDLTIVCPDKGALDRFEKIPSFVEARERMGFEVATCIKRRPEEDGDAREVMLVGGKVRGRRTVIIDDLLRSGNTTFECAGILADAGAASIEAYCTHTSFLDRGWERFDGKLISRYYTTNSIPDAAKALKGNPNAKVFSLALSIINAIREGLT